MVFGQNVEIKIGVFRIGLLQLKVDNWFPKNLDTWIYNWKRDGNVCFANLGTNVNDQMELTSAENW